MSESAAWIEVEIHLADCCQIFLQAIVWQPLNYWYTWKPINLHGLQEKLVLLYIVWTTLKFFSRLLGILMINSVGISYDELRLLRPFFFIIFFPASLSSGAGMLLQKMARCLHFEGVTLGLFIVTGNQQAPLQSGFPPVMGIKLGKWCCGDSLCPHQLYNKLLGD